MNLFRLLSDIFGNAAVDGPGEGGKEMWAGGSAGVDCAELYEVASEIEALLDELGEERGEAGMAARATEGMGGPATLVRRSTDFGGGLAQSASEWASIEARWRPNLHGFQGISSSFLPPQTWKDAQSVLAAFWTGSNNASLLVSSVWTHRLPNPLAQAPHPVRSMGSEPQNSHVHAPPAREVDRLASDWVVRSRRGMRRDRLAEGRKGGSLGPATSQGVVRSAPGPWRRVGGSSS